MALLVAANARSSSSNNSHAALVHIGWRPGHQESQSASTITQPINVCEQLLLCCATASVRQACSIRCLPEKSVALAQAVVCNSRPCMRERMAA